MLLLIPELSERNIVVLNGNLNGHVSKHVQGYEGVHGGCEYGARNAEDKRILKFEDALRLAVCSTIFVKRENGLVIYELGDVRRQIDYFSASDIPLLSSHFLWNLPVTPTVSTPLLFILFVISFLSILS